MDFYQILINIANLLGVLYLLLENRKVFIPPTNLSYTYDLTGDGNYMAVHYKVKLMWSPCSDAVLLTLLVNGNSSPPLNLVAETGSYTFTAQPNDKIDVLISPITFLWFSLRGSFVLPPYSSQSRNVMQIDTKDVNALVQYVSGTQGKQGK